MLSYWSQPYPDEILYSIIARHISYFGNAGPKQLLPDLFDRANVSSTIDLPSGLASLAKRTSDHRLGVTELLYKHTLFPYYGKFMSEERKAEVIESMLDKSGDVHTRCGINAGLFPSFKMPRYCPVCYREDMETSEETFFRRAHQIPSMRICAIHNVYLCELKPNVESIGKHFFVKPKSLTERSLLFTKMNHNKEVLEIGKKIVDILTRKSMHNFENTPLFYNEAIKQLGFRKGGISLQIEEIYQAFDDFYDGEMLEHYKSSVDVTNQSCWLKAIFRKHRKGFDPVRHVLVLNFIEHLKSNKECESLEGKQSEKYVCRNPVCREFDSNKHTHFHIKIDPKSKREITYIECKCGYAYTKSYIKSRNSFFIRVKSFGELWETELKKLIKSGRSIRSIAKELLVDSKTIVSNLNRVKKRKPGTNVLIRKREWCRLKKEFPAYSITELRRIKPAIYTYLYRHAKDWLINQNYPKIRRVVTIKIDWKKRDIQLLAMASNAKDQLTSDNPKRRRSTTSLLNLIGKESMFRVNKDRLPRLTTFLDKNTESLHQFRLRRLGLAAIDLKMKRESFSYWKLLRAANIRKEYISISIHENALKIVNGSIKEDIQIYKSA